MDAIREQLNKPLVVGIAALILGIILGVFYAWVINPVEWTDAAVEHLRFDLQEDYLRMAIDSYSVNKDVELATNRYAQLGEEAIVVWQSVLVNPGTVQPNAIQEFGVAVGVESAAVVPTPIPDEGTTGGGIMRTLLPILCVITLVVVAALAYFFFVRSRTGPSAEPSQSVQPSAASAEAEWTGYEVVGEEPPMVQFMASYRLGDDLFDDSFSIDSPAGEFLGECGVGISETIGVGEPKRVTAFEVWLFDKNDIQTVTKVLMSAHAFLDESIRQRLAAKGEPGLAEAESESVLETQTLRLVARVVDMGYGDGAMPEHSFFDQLVLELAIWPKA
jgi:hypothetical protein